MTEQQERQAQYIVNEIIDDLTGRGGLQNSWEEIDEDIQEEIRGTWLDIARDVIKG